MLYEKVEIEKYENKNLNIVVEVETIQQILDFRKEKKTYNFIIKTLNIKEHILKLICNKYKVTNATKLTENDIEYIRKVYSETNNIKQTKRITKFSRETIISYIYKKEKQTIDERKKGSSKYVIEWRRRAKIELVQYKGGKCERCGYDKCIDALEFHHLNPDDKDFTVSGKSWSIEKLKNEVDKCILVCSNCHKEIHVETRHKLEANKSDEKIFVYKKKEIKEKPKCKICDNKCKTSASVYCSNECFDIGRAENIPTKTDFVFKLKELHNFVQIGKYYNVSDNSIRKWCKKYDIPTTKIELKEYLKKE